MPRSLQAAGCFRTAKKGSAGFQHVWISDEVLNAAFCRFSHRHRRYGSSVPGPLEARRRSTKRKNTSLAHHDRGIQPMDAAVLFGKAPHGQWWQRSSTTETRSSLFPTWLFDNPTPSLTAVPVSRGEQPSTDLQMRALEEKLKKDLQTCTKLKAIRKLVKTSDLNLRAHPSLALIAFRRLLHLHWSDKTAYGNALAEVLCDPFFNPPGSRIHRLFFQEIRGKPITRKSWDVVYIPALQNAIRLGLIPAEDLGWIMLQLPKTMKSCHLDSKLDDGLPLSDWHNLLTSIDRCEVLNVSDLGTVFRDELVTILSTTAVSEKSVKLLWRLQRESKSANLMAYSKIVISRLKKLSTRAENPVTAFVDLLADLPVDQQGAAILLTSQMLTADMLKGKDLQIETRTWFRILSCLNSTDTSFTIDQTTWDEAAGPHESLTPFQNLLTMAWTISCLSIDKNVEVRTLAMYGFEQQTRTLLSEQGVSWPQDILSSAISCLKSLPLPGKDLLLQDLSQLSGANLVTLMKIDNYDMAVQRFNRCDIRVLHDDKFFHWAEQNFPDSLGNLSKSINSNIASFTQLARSLIMTDKRSLKIVRRILKYNTPMKVAASQWSTVKSIPSPSTAGESGLNQNTIVQLINDLATATSISPVLGHRSAFRHVYWFYLWLHQYGAPITQNMTKALWHAGVARYGEGGCPSTQMKFCLNKVREVEGSKIADLLLWNAAYRKSRIREMTTKTSTVSPQPRPFPAKQRPRKGKFEKM